VIGIVGTSIIDAQYEDCRGHLKPVAGLAYVIHTYTFRGLACLQVYTVCQYDEAVWEDNLRTLKDEIEGYYAKIGDTLRKCKHEVGDNLNADFQDKIKTTGMEELWRQLSVDYEAVVDMRYLEVHFGDHNGWENVTIYRAQYVKTIDSVVPGRVPRGIIIFNWLTENSGHQNTPNDDKASAVVNEIRTACRWMQADFVPFALV